MRNQFRENRRLKIKIATNLVVSVLVISIGALCLAPIEDSVTAEVEGSEIYRFGRENSNGVSLMFNVYWGTDEVYRILDILEKHNLCTNKIEGYTQPIFSALSKSVQL
jgi:hypothetical protein